MLKGSLFVIPNNLVFAADVAKYVQEDWARRLAWAGVDASPEDRLVQVWWTNKDCDNWRSHKWDLHPEIFGNIPDHIPVRIFDGKKEGDKVAFLFGGNVEVEVELRQLDYRYRWCGPFEQALSRLLDRT
jgi:hypothetical protein